MNYYYDILVNLEVEFYEFYEWEKNDPIIAIKKTPLFKVSHNVIVDFLTYDITLDEELTINLLEKTICKNKEKINALLISDTKTSLFLEINDNGKVIFKSKLLVEDENNINEIVNALRETNLKYQVGKKVLKNNLLRQTIKEQKLILIELNGLKKNKDVDKCNYLYFELFHKIDDDYEQEINDMINFLDKGDVLMIHHLAHLIGITYEERL